MKQISPFQVLARVVRAFRRRAARRRLVRLNDHLLRDIGIERCDIPYLIDGTAPPADIRAGKTTVFRHIPVMRPGLRGVGKVNVDRRRLLWVWTHALSDRIVYASHSERFPCDRNGS